MKKTLMVFIMLVFSITLVHAGTIANIISYNNLLLTIDRGSSDGVELGMKGIVKAIYKEPSGEYTINIGIFTVKKLFPRSAEVLAEVGKGLNPEDARYVVFDRDLISRQSKAEVPAEPKTESTVQAKPSASIDALLEQGDMEANAGNNQEALNLYKKAFAQSPGSLIAKEKCNEMQKRIDFDSKRSKFADCIKKSDANYEKNDIKFAFLYLAEGLRIFPEGSAEVKERLMVMNREYPREIDEILKEKTDEQTMLRESY